MAIWKWPQENEQPNAVLLFCGWAKRYMPLGEEVYQVNENTGHEKVGSELSRHAGGQRKPLPVSQFPYSVSARTSLVPFCYKRPMNDCSFMPIVMLEACFRAFGELLVSALCWVKACDIGKPQPYSDNVSRTGRRQWFSSR